MVSPYIGPSTRSGIYQRYSPTAAPAVDPREAAQARAAAATKQRTQPTALDIQREQAQARANSAQARPQPLAAAAPAADTGGYYDPGYSSGSSAAGIVAAAAPPPPVLDDNYIRSNFLYTSQQGENDRLMREFDNSTQQGATQVQQDQGLRRAELGDRLKELGLGNAEGMATRGLLRSGLTFQAQDKIDREGVKQNTVIDGLLTDYTNKRQQGRLQQEAAARAAQQKAIENILSQYATQYGVGTA